MWLPVSLCRHKNVACIGGSGFVQAKSLLHVNIPRHTAGVKLLQQQQINGRGSEQAVNGNYCMHMHKGGALRAFAASKYHCFEKWAWLTK